MPTGAGIPVYGKTKREAQERMRAALSAADNGIRPIRGRETVAGWLEEWLTTSVSQRCRPRTVDSYRETCARYIDPAIGHLSLARLEARDVQRMLAGLSRRGLSPSTVRYAHAVLRISLNRALKAGRVLRNAAAMVDPPARAAHEIRPLTAEQVGTFLANIDGDRLAGLYVVAVGTGLRQGELLGLRCRTSTWRMAS